MARAIDLHVHPSTHEWLVDGLGPFTRWLDAFHTLEPTPEVEQKILIGNAAKLLGVPAN